MKIALIWPKSSIVKYRLPLPYGYLISNMSSGHEVRIIDCNLNDLDHTSPEFIEMIKDFNPEVVGLSTDSMIHNEAVRFLPVAKSVMPKVITIIGGIHATCYPYKTMENQCLDFLMRGEAELSFPKFIKELEKNIPDWSKVPGLLYRTSDGSCKENEIQLEMNLDKIKIPDYDAMQLDDYLTRGWRCLAGSNKRHTFMWTTRGCPYRCQYCSAPIMNGKRVRTHSIEYLVDWVKYLYYEKRITFVNIIDDNFTYYTRFAKEFCKAMINLEINDLKFNTPNGIRVQRSDAELFRLMKKAGWQRIYIAPESGSTKTLKRMKKDLDLTIIPNKIQEIKDAGLKVNGYFMVGYPEETIEDVKKTLSFIRKNKFNHAVISVFQPLPGTPDLEKQVTEQMV
jgi:radical SAM superfamily enzyme YgiQ (UPF0313 family)